jgi:hypothetical protein
MGRTSSIPRGNTASIDGGFHVDITFDYSYIHQGSKEHLLQRSPFVGEVALSHPCSSFSVGGPEVPRVGRILPLVFTLLERVAVKGTKEIFRGFSDQEDEAHHRQREHRIRD